MGLERKAVVLNAVHLGCLGGCGSLPVLVACLVESGARWEDMGVATRVAHQPPWHALDAASASSVNLGCEFLSLPSTPRASTQLLQFSATSCKITHDQSSHRRKALGSSVRRASFHPQSTSTASREDGTTQSAWQGEKEWMARDRCANTCGNMSVGTGKTVGCER